MQAPDLTHETNHPIRSLSGLRREGPTRLPFTSIPDPPIPMPGVLIIVIVCVIVFVISACLYDDDGWGALMGISGLILAGALLASFINVQRVVTHPTLHVSFAKTPTSVTIEATVDGVIVRKTYTDISIYLLLDKADARIVWRQGLNAWGAECDSGTGFAVETGPVEPSTY